MDRQATVAFESAREFVRAFQGAVQAGFTLLAVVTGEEMRARDLLARACGGMPVVFWTAAGDVSLRDALANASAREAKQVDVLVDVQPHLADPTVTRMLREVGLGARRAV